MEHRQTWPAPCPVSQGRLLYVFMRHSILGRLHARVLCRSRWSGVLLARRLAPATTVPILDTGTEIIQGSDRILDWTGIREETRNSKSALKIGSASLCGSLSTPPACRFTLRRSRCSPGRRIGSPGIIARLAWPITQRLMISGMNAREALVPEIERQLAAELDWFEAELGQRQHLVGDDLGRADITAASLLAPLARPAACPLFRRISCCACRDHAKSLEHAFFVAVGRSCLC